MPTQYVSFSIEVTARVDCEMEKCDYGVRHSPTWFEPIDNTLEVSGFEFDGVDFNLDDMPEAVKVFLEDMAIETAKEKGEWE